jgi:hypothetical protein
MNAMPYGFAICLFYLSIPNNNHNDASFIIYQYLSSFHFILNLKIIRNELRHKLKVEINQIFIC